MPIDDGEDFELEDGVIRGDRLERDVGVPIVRSVLGSISINVFTSETSNSEEYGNQLILNKKSEPAFSQSQHSSPNRLRIPRDQEQTKAAKTHLRLSLEITDISLPSSDVVSVNGCT